MTITKYLAIPAALLFASSLSHAASSCSKLYNNKDYTEALTQCQEEAFHSGSQASFILGQMYENGLGVKINSKKAIAYYQQAVLANNLDSQIALGLYHKKNQNYLLSHVYLTLAIENGSLGASLEKEKVAQKMSKDQLMLSSDYVNLVKSAITDKKKSLAMND